MANKIAVILVFVVVAILGAEAHRTRAHQLESVNYDFTKYVQEYNKVYSTPEEAKAREAIFNSNLIKVLEHNNKQPAPAWKRGVNHLSDRAPEELKAMRGYRRTNKQTLRSKKGFPLLHTPSRNGSLPSFVDWRTTGAISAIKDQGQCGSCWAFASAETVESFWFLKSGKIMDLSPQQIASCTEIPAQCYGQGTGGCEGSSQEVAFSAIITNGGIVSEWVYPYQTWSGTDQACRFASNKTLNPVVQLSNYSIVESNSYDALMDAVANQGPVTISVDASSWSDYESGIYDGCNQTNPSIDHAVQLVGYGTENGAPYWIVRNSWTPQWGENGYIRLYRDSPARCGNDPTAADCDGGPTGATVCGTCGILYDNSYPVIKS
jgi:cathepsin L